MNNYLPNYYAVRLCSFTTQTAQKWRNTIMSPAQKVGAIMSTMHPR